MYRWFTYDFNGWFPIAILVYQRVYNGPFWDLLEPKISGHVPSGNQTWLAGKSPKKYRFC